MKPDIEDKLNEKLRGKLLCLPDFVSDFTSYLRYRKKALRTRIEYAKDIMLFLEFLQQGGFVNCEKIEDITLDDMKALTPKHIESFLDHLTCFKKTFMTPAGNTKVQEFTNSDVGKSRKLATLHEFFNYLIEGNIVEKDITHKIDIKVDVTASIKNRLTPEDMDKFYSTIIDDTNIANERLAKFHQKVKFRDYIIILLFSYTGIRVSELVQLDTNEVSVSDKVMIVTRKGGKQERVTLPSIILEDIDSYINQRKETIYETKALFVSMQRKRIDPKTIRAMINKYRLRAGIEINVTPHVFRRTFGTEHYNLYRDMYLTAQIMGHRSAETTRKFYADPSEERRVKSMQGFTYQQNQDADNTMSVNIETLKELSKMTGLNLEQLLKVNSR